MDSLLGKLVPNDTASIVFSFAALYIVYTVGASLYDAFFGPLSKFPGPKLNAISVLPAIFTLYFGTDSTDIPALHAKYGPVVRTKPDHLSYAKGDLWFCKERPLQGPPILHQAHQRGTQHHWRRRCRTQSPAQDCIERFLRSSPQGAGTTAKTMGYADEGQDVGVGRGWQES
jgi:hypothetical protein